MSTLLQQAPRITRGTSTISFSHDRRTPALQAARRGGTTLYMASAAPAERFVGSGGGTRWTKYFVVGGELVGMRVENSDTRLHALLPQGPSGLDRRHHQREPAPWSSACATTPGASAASPNGTDDPSGSITSQTTRGFTGHEELARVALVHMNGRVYDPLLGRFGTADPDHRTRSTRKAGTGTPMSAMARSTSPTPPAIASSGASSRTSSTRSETSSSIISAASSRRSRPILLRRFVARYVPFWQLRSFRRLSRGSRGQSGGASEQG